MPGPDLALGLGLGLCLLPALGCLGDAAGWAAAWGGQQDRASFPRVPLKVPVELVLGEDGCGTR